MRLVADDPVDHLRARLLEARGDLDVRRLVEARPQLDDDRDFLARARRLDECFHQLRVGAGAIDRLTDREDLGVTRRGADQVADRSERLERMVEENVLPPNHREDRRLLEVARRPGDKGAVLQVGAIDEGVELVESVQVHRPVDPVEVLFAELELIEEELLHLFRAVFGDLEARRTGEAATVELPLERLHQVVDFFFIDVQIGVSGDPELVAPLHPHAGEELFDVRVDHRGEHDELPRLIGILRRERDDAGEHPRRLDDRGTADPAERILPLQGDDEVQRLVRDPRERVRRIEPDRRQDREHFAVEVVLDPLALLRGPVPPLDQLDVLRLEGGEDLVVEDAVLLFDQSVRALGDHHQECARRETVCRQQSDLIGDVLFDPRDANLEELIEVRGRDRQEAQALEERDARIARELQHAVVELEQAELAIEVERRIVERDRRLALARPGFPVGGGARLLRRLQRCFRRARAVSLGGGGGQRGLRVVGHGSSSRMRDGVGARPAGADLPLSSSAAGGQTL